MLCYSISQGLYTGATSQRVAGVPLSAAERTLVSWCAVQEQPHCPDDVCPLAVLRSAAPEGPGQLGDLHRVEISVALLSQPLAFPHFAFACPRKAGIPAR